MHHLISLECGKRGISKEWRDTHIPLGVSVQFVKIFRWEMNCTERNVSEGDDSGPEIFQAKNGEDKEMRSSSDC